MRTLLILGRVSNLPTVWTNCLAAWVLAGYLFESEDIFALNGGRLLLLIVGASLLYVGGMILNDVCDVGWDREHAKDRPIPAGKISQQGAASLAVFGLGAGALMVVVQKPSTWPWVSGLVAAIVLYDFVHKRWVGSVLLMGACRFLLYVLAGLMARAGESSSSMPGSLWIGAAGVFLFVVGITVAARGESTGGRVPWGAWLLLLAPLVAWIGSGAGWAGSVFALIFAGWLWRCGRMLRGDDPARVGRFVSGLLAGIVLLDAMMASTADWKAAAICLLFFPVTLVLQRYVPAT